MIPAAADWISVPLKDRGMHERKGWLFQSEVTLDLNGPGSLAKGKAAVMWRPRPALDEDAREAP
jgi:hypothetical protein